MVAYLTLHSVRRIADRLFVLSNQHSSLSEAVLTGLGMFGLAANGMCLAALIHSLPQVSKYDLVAER